MRKCFFKLLVVTLTTSSGALFADEIRTLEITKYESQKYVLNLDQQQSIQISNKYGPITLITEWTQSSPETPILEPNTISVTGGFEGSDRFGGGTIRIHKTSDTVKIIVDGPQVSHIDSSTQLEPGPDFKSYNIRGGMLYELDGTLLVNGTEYTKPDGRIGLYVKIPKKLNPDTFVINSENGKIHILPMSETDKKMEIQSVNGDIHYEMGQGELRIENTNGNIKVSNHSGSLEARNHNGTTQLKKSGPCSEPGFIGGSIQATHKDSISCE